MTVLDDGSYDAFVVDADIGADGVARVELAITSGARKGDLVSVRARVDDDPIALLGLPALLIVDGGEPRVVFDRA